MDVNNQQKNSSVSEYDRAFTNSLPSKKNDQRAGGVTAFTKAVNFSSKLILGIHDSIYSRVVQLHPPESSIADTAGDPDTRVSEQIQEEINVKETYTAQLRQEIRFLLKLSDVYTEILEHWDDYVGQVRDYYDNLEKVGSCSNGKTSDTFDSPCSLVTATASVLHSKAANGMSETVDIRQQLSEVISGPGLQIVTKVRTLEDFKNSLGIRLEESTAVWHLVFDVVRDDSPEKFRLTLTKEMDLILKPKMKESVAEWRTYREQIDNLKKDQELSRVNSEGFLVG